MYILVLAHFVTIHKKCFEHLYQNYSETLGGENLRQIMIVSSICFLNLKILASFKPKKFDSFLKFTYMDNVTEDN